MSLIFDDNGAEDLMWVAIEAYYWQPQLSSIVSNCMAISVTNSWLGVLLLYSVGNHKLSRDSFVIVGNPELLGAKGS